MTEVVSDSTGPNMFILTRTWTATDSCSNTATDSQVITVNDTLFDGGYPNGIGSPDGNVIKNLTVSPNPFITSTNIQFSLSADADVSVELYNAMGMKLRSLYNGHVTAGTNISLHLSPDAAVGPGMYLLVVRTDHGISSRHLILTR
jgi:hypothetical protein